MKKVILKVRGMHCSSCEIILREGIEELGGVSRVVVSHDKSTAEVEFDEEKLDEERIKQLIIDEGYKIE